MCPDITIMVSSWLATPHITLLAMDHSYHMCELFFPFYRLPLTTYMVSLLPMLGSLGSQPHKLGLKKIKYLI